MSHDTITFEKTDTIYSITTRERLAILCGPSFWVRGPSGYLSMRDGPVLAWMIMTETNPGWLHKASGRTSHHPANLALELIRDGLVFPKP